jgi:hypothetical protein
MCMPVRVQKHVAVRCMWNFQVFMVDMLTTCVCVGGLNCVILLLLLLVFLTGIFSILFM